jgi:hypothetical protein
MAHKIDNVSRAKAAKFQMDFAIQMMNVGRLDTANECFQNARDTLDTIIKGGES